MRKIRFVSAQPATKYYAWQVEVMINNFMEMGVNPNHIDVVCWKENGIVPEEWSRLANNYPVRFFFYNDERETKHYISSIRPNILKQHWLKYPELQFDTIFYHDCDIIFTKPISEWISEDMINDDNWYGSDTRWYIAHSYIKGKGDDVLKKMCEIVDIREDIVERNELNAIGAQYIMKDLTYFYWNNVEKDSERLYKEISELNVEKKRLDPTYHELQIWCADMWSVLWNGWKLNRNTICDKGMDFSWGTSGINDYYNMNIMHNAGVVDGNGGLFYKAQWMNEYPYGKTQPPNENTASYKYWEWVEKVGKKSVL